MPKLCIDDFHTLSDNSSAKLHDNEHFPIVLLAFRQGFVNTTARKSMMEKHVSEHFEKCIFRSIYIICSRFLAVRFFRQVNSYAYKKEGIEAIIDYINKATLMVT